MTKRIWRCAAVLALVLPSAALAQQGNATFEAAGRSYSLPLPKGFCVPTGDEARAAALLAKADGDNVTLLSIVSCNGGMATGDYYLIKVPTGLMGVKTSRAEALPLLLAEMPTLETEPDLAPDKLGNDTGKALSDAMGTQVDVEMPTRIVGLGHDQSCVYMGGVARVAAAGLKYSVAVSACLTVVGEQMMTFYHYAPGTKLDEARALMPSVRKLADAAKLLPKE